MREIRCAIELRQDDDRQSPGRIFGTLITYEKRAADRPELFADGSLSWPEGGVVLNVQHDRQQPVMRFTPEVRGKLVVVDAPLPDTSRGRDVATMIRNGTMTGLSIEFRSQDEGQRAGLREVRKAALVGAALVDTPAYAGSLEMRHGGAQRRRVWL